MGSSAERQQSYIYQIFVLVSCILALFALGVDKFIDLDPATQQILVYADYAVCVLFLMDFALSLYWAKNRIRYLYTWGWIDLLSSIPAVEIFRLGRLARVFRVFRILRGVRATKIISAFILDRRAEGVFLAAALLSILLVIVGSIAILEFERTPEANIKSAEDALWWAAVTVTTVGYGDRFPVTTEGRFVAVVLMTAGVGLFGTFAGFVAAWFLEPSRKRERSELEAIRDEIATLRQELKEEKR